MEHESEKKEYSKITFHSNSYIIVGLWKNHYRDLFNCIQSNRFNAGNVDCNEDMVVWLGEVQEAIKKLGDNKSCGLDYISAEHLQ